jgi:hypothetical protein
MTSGNMVDQFPKKSRSRDYKSSPAQITQIHMTSPEMSSVSSKFIAFHQIQSNEL